MYRKVSFIYFIVVVICIYMIYVMSYVFNKCGEFFLKIVGGYFNCLFFGNMIRGIICR